MSVVDCITNNMYIHDNDLHTCTCTCMYSYVIAKDSLKHDKCACRLHIHM